MILYHRATPVIILCCAIFLFWSLFFGVDAWRWVGVMLGAALVVLFLGRLLKFAWHERSFWMLGGVGVIYLLTTTGFLFFLEGAIFQFATAIGAAVLLAMFAEHVFAYVHMPTLYQPYTLEYLSLVMNVLSLFYLGSSLFGLQLFLQVHPLLLVIVMAGFSFVIMQTTFWTSKIEEEQTRRLSILGTLFLTELFLALGFLPLGFYPNAVLLTLAGGLFLLLARGYASQSLTRKQRTRVLIGLTVLTLFILVTAQWV